MKILMLIASLDVGGAETHLCELSLALNRMGDDITIASEGGAMLSRFNGSGINHLTLPLSSKNPLKILFCYRRLLHVLKSNSFDVIHAHSRVAAYIGEKLSKALSIPFVTTVHASFSLSPLRRIFSRWGYYTCAVSDDLALYLCREYGISGERIRVIPNGINTEYLKPKKREENERKRLLFVSRLDSDCSDTAYALCRIAKALSDIFHGIEIRIAGGGSELERIRNESDKLNMSAGYNLVTVLGHLDDVKDELQAADIFIGVSRAALEAAACGVRVILSGNEGYLGELTEENTELAKSTNFCCRGLAPISDSSLFFDIESLLLQDPILSARRSEFIRRYVEQHHSIKSCAEETRGLYSEAISKVSFLPRRPIRQKSGVCLCGYYGFGNVGDDALLECSISRARHEGECMITALTKAPNRDIYRFGVPCISRKNPFSVFGAIKRSKRFIFGGGTLFQDSTSLRSLLYYYALALAAKRAGTRIELWGSGLGPIRTKTGKKALAHVLSNASCIELRDRASLTFALSLGIPSDKLLYTRDMAFDFVHSPLCRSDYTLRQLEIPDEKPFAVISVSGRASNSEYNIIKRRAIKLLENGILPVIAIMYPHEDTDISRRLSREIGGICAEKLCVSELLSLLRRAECSVGMRLHLLIFSALAALSFEGVGNDPKITAFCRENGGTLLR